MRRPVKRTLVAFAWFLVLGTLSCARPQAGQVIAHWDHVASGVEHAQPVGDGFLLVRRTALRNVFEWFRPDGTIAWRFFNDRPVTKLYVSGTTVWFIDEQSPGIGHVWKTELSAAAPGQPPTPGTAERVSERGNWTDLVKLADGRLLGFESLFLSRDVAPSAVKVWDLANHRPWWQDNFSYHYPVEARTLLVVSPIDRRVRSLAAAGVTEVGQVNSLEFPPLARPDGLWTAWFGPHAAGSALFLADEAGFARLLRAPYGERAMTWLGADLLVAERDELNGRWTLSRLSVPDGLVKGTIPVPDGITPSKILASPSGDFVGLPSGTGSLLLRLSDHFIQDFPGVPLTAWRFSPDGRRLYLAQRDTLQVVDLK